MSKARSSSRLFRIGRSIAGNLMAQLRCRAELFAVELREEKNRVIRQLVRLAIALVLAAIGFAFLNVTLVVLAPAEWRWAVLLGLGAAYSLIAGFVLVRLRNDLKRSPKPFSETLNELRKDRECLRND